MGTVIVNGRTVDFEAAVNLMDDEIRERLHDRSFDFDDEQAFADAYAKAHAEKYDGEVWVVI